MIKITVGQLRRIIAEEVQRSLNENPNEKGWGGPDNYCDEVTDCNVTFTSITEEQFKEYASKHDPAALQAALEKNGDDENFVNWTAEDFQIVLDYLKKENFNYVENCSDY